MGSTGGMGMSGISMIDAMVGTIRAGVAPLGARGTSRITSHTALAPLSARKVPRKGETAREGNFAAGVMSGVIRDSP